MNAGYSNVRILKNPKENVISFYSAVHVLVQTRSKITVHLDVKQSMVEQF